MKFVRSSAVQWCRQQQFVYKWEIMLCVLDWVGADSISSQCIGDTNIQITDDNTPLTTNQCPILPSLVDISPDTHWRPQLCPWSWYWLWWARGIMRRQNRMVEKSWHSISINPPGLLLLTMLAQCRILLRDQRSYFYCLCNFFTFR